MKKTFLFLAFLSVGFFSCDTDDDHDDDHDHNHEQEVITTVQLTFTDTTGVASTFSFQDLDGIGGEDGTVDDIVLSANMTYDLSITVLNETEDPAEDLTSEVIEEGTEHQFFFEQDPALMTIAYNDEDENGDPIGIESVVTTTDAGTTNLTVTLKHIDETEKDGVITTGETDISTPFAVTVE